MDASSRERLQIALSVLRLTCGILAMALPTTALITFWRFGGDLAQTRSGSEMMRFALLVTLIEIMTIVPAVAYRRVKTFRTVDELRGRLHALASLDPLTGLLNRRGFDEAILAIAPGVAVAVIICDIDHFKRVNDGYGHDVGDLVLQMTADILKALGQTQAGTRLARFGGEEFVILLPGADLATAQLWAESARLRLATSRARSPKGAIAVTASFGVAAERFGGDMAALIARADAALYGAKDAGRNCVALRALDAAA